MIDKAIDWLITWYVYLYGMINSTVSRSSWRKARRLRVPKPRCLPRTGTILIFFSFRIYFLWNISDKKILIKACKTNLTSQLRTCLYIEFKNYYLIFYFNSYDNCFCIIQRVIMGHFNVGLKAVNFNFLFLLIFIPARSKYNLFFVKHVQSNNYYDIYFVK